jgi:hypothetical protein
VIFFKMLVFLQHSARAGIIIGGCGRIDLVAPYPGHYNQYKPACIAFP